MKKQPQHYDVRAICPGSPTIGYADRQSNGTIGVLLWCSPLANQCVELVPVRESKAE